MLRNAFSKSDAQCKGCCAWIGACPLAHGHLAQNSHASENFNVTKDLGQVRYIIVRGKASLTISCLPLFGTKYGRNGIDCCRYPSLSHSNPHPMNRRLLGTRHCSNIFADAIESLTSQSLLICVLPSPNQQPRIKWALSFCIIFLVLIFMQRRGNQVLL